MKPEPVDVLIIGAGVSGLTAALSVPGRVVVLEKENEPGGWCRSIRRGPFVWDYAGHFFHFRNDACRGFFLSLFAPDELVEAEKCSRILYRGRLVDAPFQFHLHQLPKADLIDCLYDLFFQTDAGPVGSFLDMLYSSCGRAVTDKFLRPYNEKLYACDLRSLSSDAMGRFFPRADLPRIIKSMKSPVDESYNSRFYYPKQGAATFISALMRRLPSEVVRCGCALRALDPASRLAYDTRGHVYHYETLINTAPLHRFLPLLGEEEARFAATLRYAKTLVWNLGFANKSRWVREHWIYIHDKAINFYRVGFYDQLLASDRLSLYLEIGLRGDASVDVNDQLQLALQALRRCGIVEPDNRLLESAHLMMDPSYVLLEPDTRTRVDAVRRSLAEKGLYSIGRYGAWRYASMEDCIMEAQELAAVLNGGHKCGF